MMIYLMMAEDEELREKKLRGSGGYVIARISDYEQKKGNLGGPELFIAGIGRLPKDRILKYYCNKCEKDYPTSPDLNYENPNEDVGEGVVLIEKGEYKCSVCNAVLSQYRKFNNETSPPPPPSKTNSFSQQQSNSSDVTKSVDDISDSSPKNKSESENSILTSNNTHEENISDSIQSESTDTKSSNVTIAKGKYFPIQSIIGMPVYDHEAMLVGNVQEIGLRKTLNGTIQITLKIDNRDKISETNGDELYNEITWSDVSKIGDIVLINWEQKKISSPPNTSPRDKKICVACQYHNESDAMYCEQCGKKLE
jgi:sporulation protein YlmC with PRC-barrel domain